MDSGFMDSILDMDKSWTDMCGDWEETLRNAILNALVTRQFEGRIQSLYDKMAQYGSDGDFSDTEVGNLASEGEEILKDAYELRERLLKELGLDNYAGSSNSLSKGASSITEEQADLLASYVNAMRADLSVVRILWERYMELFSENGNRIAEQQLEQLSRIAENTERNAEAAEEIRELLGRATTSGSGVKVNV